MAAYCMWDPIVKKFFESANVVFDKTAFGVQSLYQKYIGGSSAPPIDLFRLQPSSKPISFEELEEETPCEEESQDGGEELIHGPENFEYSDGFYESGAHDQDITPPVPSLTQTPSEPRRSARERKKKQWNDFEISMMAALMAEEDISTALTLKTFKGAIASQEKCEWLESMKRECNALMKRKAFVLVHKNQIDYSNVVILPGLWRYRIKT